MSAEEWLAAEYERCWPWLEAALNTSPLRTHEREHLWQALQDGSCQLWPTPNSACVTEIKVFPTGLKVLQGWLAGGDLHEIKVTVRMLEGRAKRLGCDATTIQGRRGWMRAFDGYRDAGTTMTKDLC